MKFAPMNVSQGVDVLYSTLEVQGRGKHKGLLSKFLFFHDKDLYVNVLKCPLNYDETLMSSLSMFIGSY